MNLEAGYSSSQQHCHRLEEYKQILRPCHRSHYKFNDLKYMGILKSIPVNNRMSFRAKTNFMCIEGQARKQPLAQKEYQKL